MAKYFVRVELRGNPSAEAYDALHALMSNAGFGRRAYATTTSQWVDLPHAMYYGNSDLAATALAQSLTGRIAPLWISNYVLAIEWTSWGLA